MQARKKIRKKNKEQHSLPVLKNLDQRLHEAGAIFLFALTSYLFLCFLTYNPLDSGFIHISDKNIISNSGGKLGAWFTDIMFYFFGYISFWVPLCLGYAAYKSYKKRNDLIWPPCWISVSIKSFGFILALLSGSALISLNFFAIPNYFYSSGLITAHNLAMGAGGLIGKIISIWFVKMFNVAGTIVLLASGLFIGVTLVTGLSWLTVVDYIGKKILILTNNFLHYLNYFNKCGINRIKTSFENYEIRKTAGKELIIQNKTSYLDAHQDQSTLANLNINKIFKKKDDLSENKEQSHLELNTLRRPQNKIINIEQVTTKPKNLNKAKQLKIASVTPDGLPDVSLLELPEESYNQGYSESDLHNLSRLVEQKLLDFGVQAQVVGVQPGPVIVRFELQLAAGIKVSKVSSLAKDLARSLSIVSVRVVEVIPGKPYVGLEVPNTHREIVKLRELIEHPDYVKYRSALTLVLGKDISGKIKLADLSKMPHLLVAGTTGSGKSVGVNAMLLSILFKATPKDVRLIMIDPKMLELSVYDGIPHLLCPVVTDMKDAANALKWCVAEMERRYKLMATLGVRNLAGYNRKVEDARNSGEPILDPLWPEGIHEPPPELETLPFIVVVVDEFADMIMVVGRKVEELIARIAQKARAAGIHMILATQRPSVDVITGLIKANVPTRIAFQVSSKIDSRTILDQSGAEQLLGQGDMLYLPPGSGLPVRVHGAFVSDQEVHAVADDWRARQAPDYNDDIVGSTINIPGLPKLATDDFDQDMENDPLYDQAVQFILETRKPSISSVQRRFKIGYNRAARIIEQMEVAGIVSPMSSKGGRDILVPEGQGV